jgi:hypothetical protein
MPVQQYQLNNGQQFAQTQWCRYPNGTLYQCGFAQAPQPIQYEQNHYRTFTYVDGSRYQNYGGPCQMRMGSHGVIGALGIGQKQTLPWCG